MSAAIQLSEAELKIMQVLWNNSPQTMAEIAQALYADTVWSKTRSSPCSSG